MAETPIEESNLSQKKDGEETAGIVGAAPEATPTETKEPPAAGTVEGEGDDKDPKTDDPNVASLISRKNHFKTKWQEEKKLREAAEAKLAGNQPGDVPTPPTAPLTPPTPSPLPATDEELTAQFPSFPYMDPSEQAQLRSMVSIGKTVAEISAVLPEIKQFADGRRFEGAFNALTAEDTYEPLIDRREEFRTFFSLPENRGVPIKVVAESFMFRNGIAERKKKEEDDAAADAERQTRTGVLPPQGGKTTPRKEQEYTPEEVEAIRTSDPKKYREMVKKGIIK